MEDLFKPKTLADEGLEDSEIVKFLNEHPEFHGIKGAQLQETYEYFSDYLPDDENGRNIATMTWRSWGGLMAAYMNSKEGVLKYYYTDFYM